MAISFFDAFQRGVFPVGTGEWTAIQGTPTTNTVTVPPGSSRSMEQNAASVGQFIEKLFATTTQTVVVGLFGIYIPSTLNAGLTPAYHRVQYWSPSGEILCIYNSTSNELYWLVWNGTQFVESSRASAARNTWLYVDYRANVASSTMQLDWRVNGAAQTQFTPAIQSANTWYRIEHGPRDAVATNLLLTDLVAYSHTSGDYPLGAKRGIGSSPNANGTHNLDAATSAFYKKIVGGVETFLTTSETNSWETIDDMPIDADSDRIIVRPA